MATSVTGESPAEQFEISLAKRYWIKCKNEWTRALFSPLVVSLAAGNLKKDTFDVYTSQDVYFLHAFEKAYATAVEYADDDDAKEEIHKLQKIVQEEIKTRDSAVNVFMHTFQAATVEYTKFLRDTAAGKVEGVKDPGNLATPFEKTKLAAYTLGAMTPCVRLYAFLGKELKAILDANEGTHPYREWIDYYSSDNFQAAALQTEELLDKLCVSLTGDEIDITEKVYHRAMNLVVEFFLAQPLAQETVLPLSKNHNPAEHCLMLFSDFDLTCTVMHSSDALAEVAILKAQRPDQDQSGNQLARMSLADLSSKLEQNSKQSIEEHKQCIASILLLDEAEKFYYKGLCQALELLSDFRKKANMRVVDSGVLKGLNVDDIKLVGERLTLQDGCKDFLVSAIKNENLNANIHVLSYCLSGDLIRFAFSKGGIDPVVIHANELVYENSLSTGEIVKKVESPMDKLEAFTSILENRCKDKKALTVYIGHSLGDLLCLLKADIGIVIGSSEIDTLRKVGCHLCVNFVPLFPNLVTKQKRLGKGTFFGWKGLSGVVYTVDDWAEIHAFILGS